MGERNLAETVKHLRMIADYQFGPTAGRALFSAPESLEIERSRSGRPRQVHGPSGRLVSMGTDGRFTLGMAGGHRLDEDLPALDYRVTVGDESEPHVREGRNAFAKFVTTVDDGIRPGEEVLVKHADGALLAVGRATLSGAAMQAFDRGVAVAVREGSPQAGQTASSD